MTSDEIKRNISILDVARDENFQVIKRGNTFKTRCPFHTGDKNASLILYPETNSFFCFACHAGGDVIKFKQLANGCDFRTAYALLGGTDEKLSSEEMNRIKKEQEEREERERAKEKYRQQQFEDLRSLMLCAKWAREMVELNRPDAFDIKCGMVSDKFFDAVECEELIWKQIGEAYDAIR